MSPNTLPKLALRLAALAAVVGLFNPAGEGITAAAHAASPIDSGLLLYSTEGNRLRRYDLDSIGGA
ncbi:MAG: hypothetical protein HKN19_00005, partial [Halioglobus sp.]|nr:hypothetical protein [Halioglobus sp.]